MGQLLYSSNRITRADRRRIEALADAVDRAVAADRRYFERFPKRAHRLRLLSAAERQQLAMASGQDVTPPPGEEWVAIVRQVAPGARLRRFARVSSGLDLDQPETTCRAMWDAEAANSGLAAQMERDLREVMRRRP